MIIRILLLVNLNSCLCAATFVVNVTQSSYQAEENHNITLEWTFTTRPNGSINSLFVICAFRTSVKRLLCVLRDGVEVSEHQDEQFSGRVQIDKAILRDGRIRLHVSRLSTEDSGLYLCHVRTDDGVGSARCSVTVTEPRSGKMTTTETVSHRNFISPTQQDEISRNALRSRLLLCCLIIFFIAFLSSVFICYLNKNKYCQKNLLNQASTLQTGCLAQGLTCVDVEENSMKSSPLQIPQGSDSTQQLQQHGNPGEGTSLCDQSEAYR